MSSVLLLWWTSRGLWLNKDRWFYLIKMILFKSWSKADIFFNIQYLEIKSGIILIKRSANAAIKNHDKMFLENLKIYYCYSVRQESYDKIKTIIPDIKITQGLDVFNIFEANSCLSSNHLAESTEEWSQEMLQLFTGRSHPEKLSITVVLHRVFHQSKCMRKLALNCTYYIIYRVVRDSSSLITLNKQIHPGEQKFIL